jgi:TonB family protein
MKHRSSLLLCGLLLATAALAQRPSATQNRTLPSNTACPSPRLGEIAWFDTCAYLPPGSGVKMARPFHTPDPEYAESARHAKIQGTVQLAVAINATGVVDAVRVVKPLEPGLDQNAVTAINMWRFTPATKDGKPVPVQTEIEVEYRLY